MIYILVGLVGILIGAIIRGLLTPRCSGIAMFMTMRGNGKAYDLSGETVYCNMNVMPSPDGKIYILETEDTKDMTLVDFVEKMGYTKED